MFDVMMATATTAPTAIAATAPTAIATATTLQHTATE